MNKKAHERREFRIGILGLSRLERAMVTSVCSLSRSRLRGYSVLPEEHRAEADILLIDADDLQVCAFWLQSLPRREGKPALLITSHPTRQPALLEKLAFGRQVHLGKADSASDTPTKGATFAGCLAAAQPDQVRQADNGRYLLPRNNFATRLLRTLDQITIQEFKCLPELVVGDNEPCAQPPALPLQQSSSIARRRALVVDDSLVARTNLQMCLQVNGLDVDLAANAENAVQMAREVPYAIVFLDVMLPGMDGYAACRQMRASAIDSTLPVVMLTGRDSAFDRMRGVMAGCTRYLVKPVQAGAVRDVLQQLIPGLK